MIYLICQRRAHCKNEQEQPGLEWMRGGRDSFVSVEDISWLSLSEK